MKAASARSRGFTLVEVLVAMSLLSLVLLVLGSSIRSMGASAERIDARSARIDEMRVATTFLREIAGRAAAQRLEAPAVGLLFAGSADSVSWVGVMPPRFGAAGRHFFRLAVERVDDGSSGLVLRFVPWRWDQKVMPDWSRAESRVLVRNLSSAALSYAGNGMGEAWLAAWPPEEKKLPPRLRLLLSAAGSEWPPIVLAMHPLPASAGGGGGGFVRGPE
ncbi:MAG: ral secretion pathway protein [Ramlibacter sp.]|jgi:general secretion pathway protein J|nr:ral secretion pathway protein [Ramlibacter sp.]